MPHFIDKEGKLHPDYIWLGLSPPLWSTSLWYVPEKHRAFFRSQVENFGSFDRVMKELRRKYRPWSDASPNDTGTLWCPCIPIKGHLPILAEKYSHVKPYHVHHDKDHKKHHHLTETELAREVAKSSREFRRKLEDIQARRQADKALRQYEADWAAVQDKLKEIEIETRPPPTATPGPPPPSPQKGILKEKLHHDNMDMLVYPSAAAAAAAAWNNRVVKETTKKRSSSQVIHRRWNTPTSRCSQNVVIVNSSMSRSIQIM